MGEQVRKAVAVRRLPLVVAAEIAALEGDVVADAVVCLVLPDRDFAPLDADFVDGAFFGIGGSSIDTPLLRVFLHVPQHIALASPLPTALLTIAIAFAVLITVKLLEQKKFGAKK